MLELLHDINLMPFHLSLFALVLLSMVETVGYFLNIRPSQFFKRIIPQRIAEAPLLSVKFSKILILVFLLMNFSFSGYFLQFSYFAQQEKFLPAYYVILPALIIAIFFTVFMIHCLDQVIRPKQIQLQANLLGRLATISSGNARPGFSAQARVRDEYGQLHYVQVEPEFGELVFQSQIILIRIKHSHYIAKKISKSNQLFSSEINK
ncbi:OB-fold-containig protein [Acinetobacter zhairhuonensis]|uniref:OB-fold-containig protein n=1 Tax=Acinetobacter sp. A7.4 TaxID=2919921 RepID=UPI001F4E018F|nr:OB-fold-containig protein [Acinetobacter sp. A7.4]MCJ8160732.1 YqiJ family protein [Acinetobacter sp. A7.4]